MLQRLAYWCTAPRVTLFAILAVGTMLVLFLEAEMPLSNALQVAVALHRIEDCAGTTPKGLSASSPPYLRSFDERVDGYSDVDVVKTILCGMQSDNNRGKDIYVTRHFPIDVFFAVTYSIAFAAIWLFLLQAYQLTDSALRYVAVIPLLAGVFDIAEDLGVLALVERGLSPYPSVVSAASWFTVIKFYLFVSSALIIFSFLLWFLVSGALKKS